MSKYHRLFYVEYFIYAKDAHVPEWSGLSFPTEPQLSFDRSPLMAYSTLEYPRYVLCCLSTPLHMLDSVCYLECNQQQSLSLQELSEKPARYPRNNPAVSKHVFTVNYKERVEHIRIIQENNEHTPANVAISCPSGACGGAS